MASLFTTVGGRIGRKEYWIGSVLLFAAVIVLTLIVAAIGGAAGGSDRASTVITVLILSASVPLVVKRLQDRNKSPHVAWLLYGPAIIATIGESVGFTGASTQPNALGYVLALFNLVIGIWFFIELGFLRGTLGPNAYGPDPLAAQE